MTIKIKKLQTTWIMLVEEFQKVYTIELKFSLIFVLNFQIFLYHNFILFLYIKKNNNKIFKKRAQRGSRSHSLKIKSLTLYQLS